MNSLPPGFLLLWNPRESFLRAALVTDWELYCPSNAGYIALGPVPEPSVKSWTLTAGFWGMGFYLFGIARKRNKKSSGRAQAIESGGCVGPSRSC